MMKGETVLGVEYLGSLQMNLLANPKQLRLYVRIAVACRPCERMCWLADEAEVVDLLPDLERQAEEWWKRRERRCFYSCCS